MDNSDYGRMSTIMNQQKNQPGPQSTPCPQSTTQLCSQSMSQLGYVPSGKTLESIIANLNNATPHELSIPGNWSPTLFFEDLKIYPVVNKRVLINELYRACCSHVSYLEFFERTRGHSKSISYPYLYELFDRGSVMLYMETFFLNLLKRPNQMLNDSRLTRLFEYIEILSKNPVSKWNEILNQIGCCCYQFFVKEPELYLPVIFKSSSIESKTDQELLSPQGNVSPTKYQGKISIYDSRSALLKSFKN